MGESLWFLAAHSALTIPLVQTNAARICDQMLFAKVIGDFLLSDEISLADVIADAISDYYNDPENPVIVTGFLIATNVVEADGRPGISVTYPETQAYSQSLGLIAFADEYVRDDVRQAFNEIRDV